MANTKKANQKTLAIGLAVALVFVAIGVFVLSYALETFDVQAEILGFQENSVYQAPFSDYAIMGFENVWGALLIGIAGTLLLFIVSLGVAKLIRRRSAK